MKRIERDEVLKHSNEASCWIIVEDKVYDVSEFVRDHPGGAEVLLEYGGGDVTELMRDVDSHKHSAVAYSIMEKYQIGTLADPRQKDDQILAAAEQAKQCANFLDLKRPLVWQVLMEKRYSKKYYLEQVHIGRYMSRSAELFGWKPMEMLTRTPWWVIPAFWLPIVQKLGGEATYVFSPAKFVVLYSLGILMWTFLEYMFHRFLFHIDSLLPDNQVAFTVHFLLHGVHHFLPMDRYRLVFPPVLFIMLSGSVWMTFKLLGVEYHWRCGIFCGALSGYIVYDMLHYSFHHAKMPSEILRKLKNHHMRHHYETDAKGFGVSSPIWDWVFGTGF